MKSVVVTGASTGIGLGVVKVLIQNGYRVFGSVRKQADAERLKANFGDAFTPLIFDVTDEAAVQAAAEQVRSELGGETLFGLVNNAGVATPAPIMHQPIADFRSQMEINLVGQLIVSQAFIPLLGADRTLSGKPGRIVNMSSVSGKRGSPFVGAYVASKHALEGLSETMRIELMLYGIDVIIVGPGAVATPIWDKAEQVDLTPYQNSDYLEAAVKLQKFLVEDGRKGYPPEKVGEVVLRALTATRPRVRYSVVPNALKNWVIPSLLPKRLMDLILAKALGFKKMKQHIGSISLVVRDYDEAIDFYTHKLRFDLVEDKDMGEGKRWILVSPPGSAETCLLLAKAATPRQESCIGDQTGGRVFLFLHTDDFWRDYKDMQANGVRFLEEPRHEPYGTVVVFEDLYGNKWDLLELKR